MVISVMNFSPHYEAISPLIILPSVEVNKPTQEVVFAQIMKFFPSVRPLSIEEIG